MAGPSSSHASPPLTIAPTDPTYVSLRTLLSSPASSSRHLNLLPPGGLYGSITLYIARLESDDALTEFIKTLLTSESLWKFTNVIDIGTPTRIHEDITSTENQSPSLAHRLYHLHLAIARAVFSHIEALLLRRDGSIGWRTQRALKAWVDVVVASSRDLEAPVRVGSESKADSLTHIPRLSILSGLVVGLGAYRQQQRDKKNTETTKAALDVSRALGAAQAAWIDAFHDAMERVGGGGAATPPVDEWEQEFVQVGRDDSHQHSLLLLLHLTGQVSPYLSDRILGTLKPEPILTLFPQALLPLFQLPLLNLTSDPPQIKTPTTHALYPLLGPLSRILASAGENTLVKMPLQDVQRLLLGGVEQDSQAIGNSPGVVSQLFHLSGELYQRFLTNELTDSKSTTTTELWSSLKAFLFTSVQFFDAVLDGIVEILPSPVYPLMSEERYLEQQQDAAPTSTSNIPPVLTTILLRQVESLMRLAFVTFSITNDGSDEAKRITSNEIYNRFTTYRHAFYGALEVIKSDLGASVALLHRLETYITSSTDDTWLSRAHHTTLLDACEQLVPILPNPLIEARVLPLCKSNLQDATYPALFESSHSVLLAIFESKKAVCQHLMPFYLDTLLLSLPRKLLSQQQFSHALCTIVACTSDVDDAASYYVVECIEQVVKGSKRRIVYGQEQHPEQQHQDLDEETKLHFKLAYIDLLPFVNLVLLRSLLHTVESWILRARDGKDGSTAADDAHHQQLCKRTFKALNGMDDTARQEGVRWWLEKREAFGV